MAIPKITRDLIKEVAAEYDLTFEEVREAVFSQYKFLLEVIRSGDKSNSESFKSVRLSHLGTFYPLKRSLKYMVKKIKLDDEEHTGELHTEE